MGDGGSAGSSVTGGTGVRTWGWGAANLGARFWGVCGGFGYRFRGGEGFRDIFEGDGGAVSLEALEGLLGAIKAALIALLELEALIDEAIRHVVEAEKSFAAIGAG
jgi:hypothetical protein